MTTVWPISSDSGGRLARAGGRAGVLPRPAARDPPDRLEPPDRPELPDRLELPDRPAAVDARALPP
ncbi:hypothetical protein [Frankia sp. CcWB2]